jgi:N-terminal acetyltransferase B complex non-catalytic subunit
MRDILLKLAQRLITACWKQVEVHPDRLHLHISILQQLGLYEDARELLDTESGRFLCARNLSCDHLRREVMKAGGWQMEEGGIAEQRIVEKRSVILQYTEYTCHLEAFAGIATGSSLSLF